MLRGAAPPLRAVVTRSCLCSPLGPGAGASSSVPGSSGWSRASESGLKCAPSGPCKSESGDAPARLGCPPSCSSVSEGGGEDDEEDDDDDDPDDDDDDNDTMSSSESSVWRGPIHGNLRGRPEVCSSPRHPARTLFQASAVSHAFPGSAGLMSAALRMEVEPPWFLPPVGIQTVYVLGRLRRMMNPGVQLGMSFGLTGPFQNFRTYTGARGVCTVGRVRCFRL